MKLTKTLGLTLLLAAFFVSGVNAATITGKINYDGAVPKFKPLKMDADPICITKHKDEVLPQTLVLSENKEMANVYVHVTKGISQKDFPTPTEEIVITQEGCMYTPHVLGVQVGQTVKILNPDGTLHNVHAITKVNPEFNIAMPKFRKEVTQVFEKPEFMLALRCDVHPWMGAWVTVSEHPFFSVTGNDGVFTIADLPAGEYEIEAWHEKLGTQTATVTVAEGETAEANFTFSRPSK